MIGGIEHYLPPLQLQFHALHLVSLAEGLTPSSLNSANIPANDLYPLPTSFLLDLAGHVSGSPLGSWHIMQRFQSVSIGCWMVVDGAGIPESTSLKVFDIASQL